MLERLHQHITPGAIYDSVERFDTPKCYPGTRTDIITGILDWAGGDSKAHPFLWMYGPAGSGKSSIAQTIAEMLAKQCELAASHFFSRTNINDMDAARLVATLTYQLALNIPAFREPLTEAIERDPTIFSKPIQAQFNFLIAKPLSRLPNTDDRSGNASPRIIIIDALDECGDAETQQQILSALFNAVYKSNLPLSFMISSRPEYAMRAFFDEEEVNSLTRRIDLYTGDKVDEDIENFLRSGFEDIKRNHPTKSSLQQDWPSDPAIKRLVREASGQFIYASTIIKFIGHTRRRPKEQLEIILGLRPSGNEEPFALLDSLYIHLLSSVDDWEHVAPVLQIIIRKVKKSERITLGDIAKSLHLELDELQMLLADLHSILYIPPIDQPQEEIRLHHASLANFLRDRARSGTFFIEN